MFVSPRSLAFLTIWLCACSCSVLADDNSTAPFRSVEDAHRFSDRLIAALVGNRPAEALVQARANSHRDDPQVQSNLDQVARTLPERFLALGEASSSRLLGDDAFSYSFQRFTYLIQHANGEQRCQFTFRKKVDGWRLNQMFCT